MCVASGAVVFWRVGELLCLGSVVALIVTCSASTLSEELKTAIDSLCDDVHLQLASDTSLNEVC